MASSPTTDDEAKSPRDDTAASPTTSKKKKKGETIRVAVRVRPFNAKEKKKGCKSVVSMSGQTVTLSDEVKGKLKKFAFDYCYWSQSEVAGDAAAGVAAMHVAKQEDIFKDLGLFYVNHAFDGYNSSVFAYGQTGSGKTFTMLGSAKDPGLIPRGCNELFRRVEAEYGAPDSPIKVEVEASYLEVYMDRIFDLLSAPPSKKKKKAASTTGITQAATERKKLPIRFHTKLGSYVEGLSKHAVSGYTDVRRLMALGVANRTVAETAMNKMSSRSHCIFTLYINFHHVESGEVTSSKINLIDLAGSERVTRTGVVGDRLEELKKINKSLSALGDCISALSTGAKFVPYNNSTLTTLLKESLGGNSKTVMMACISGADDNFDETLSTLRYAQRVKRIQVNAKKNKGELKATMERELRAEIERLKRRLEIQGGNADQAETIAEQVSSKEKELERMKMDFASKLQNMHKTYMVMAKRLMQMGIQVEDMAPDSGGAASALLDKSGPGGGPRLDFKVAPKLVNLSADPSLSGTMVFFLTKAKMMIGTEESVEIPDILLSSEDSAVKTRHAMIRVEKWRINTAERARSVRKQAIRVIFDECDIDDDENLTLSEFNNFCEFLLQYPLGTKFAGFTQEEFDAFCLKCGCKTELGLDFETVFREFNGGSTSAPQNTFELRGFPKKLSERSLESLSAFISDKFPVKEILLNPSDSKKVFVVCEVDVPKDQFVTVRSVIKEGSDGRWKVKVRRPDPGEMETVFASGSEIVEELSVSLGLADPKDPSSMVFVNGNRVTTEPATLEHGDHILLGSRHMFRYLVPSEMGAKKEGVSRSPRSSFSGTRPLAGMGTGDGGAAADEMFGDSSEDMNALQHLIKEELAREDIPKSIQGFQECIQRRMKECAAIRDRNVDVLNLKHSLLSSRAVGAQSGDASSLLKVHDTFMQDYRLLTAKCTAANTLSLELDKNLLFSVTSLFYFDVGKNDTSERLCVMRECHYTEPELQYQMTPPQFERLYKKLSRYAELARQDGELIATETMDDDPFVPGEVDTLYANSHARFKQCGKSTDDDQYVSFPLVRNGTDEQIGTLEARLLLFNPEDSSVMKDYDSAENKVLNLTLEFRKAKFDVEIESGFLVFCGFGDSLHQFEAQALLPAASSDATTTEDAKAEESDTCVSSELEFTDVYRCNELFVTPGVINFLTSVGFSVQLWLPVFTDVAMMPPVIAYKINSSPITIKVSIPGEADSIEITLKSGNRIAALKRKIDFISGIADDNQTLICGTQTLEDYRTLLDYGIKSGDEINVMFSSAGRRQSIDGKLHGLSVMASSVATVPEDVATPQGSEDDDDGAAELPAELVKAMQKELTNPDLTPEERARIKRVKNQSIHLQMVAIDSGRSSAMTLEGYKEENIQLKHALGLARKKIDQLQRQVASLETKLGSDGTGGADGTGGKGGKKGAGGTKFFSSWGRRKSRQK